MERCMIFEYDDLDLRAIAIAYFTDDGTLFIKGTNSKYIYINQVGYTGETMTWEPYNDNVIKVFYRGEELKIIF